MRITSARRVLEGAWAKFAGDSIDTLDTRWFAVMRDSLNRRLRQAHEFHFWPELLRVEQRRYRAAWASSGSTIPATTEYYHIASGAYYQALRSHTGTQEPATKVGGVWTTNTAYWYQCAASYSGEEWAASTAYTAGTVVQYTTDGLFYCCHTAHTSGATLDSTKFGVLTAFDKYIDLAQTGETEIGTVIGVYQRSPRIYRNGVPEDWYESDNGIQVPNGVNEPYVEFRIRSSDIFGDAYSATGTYAVGDQVYYRSSTAPVTYPGQFYVRATDTSTAGESPESDSANWTRIDIPYRFQEFLVTAIYEDALAADGQVDKSLAEEGRAMTFLAEEVGKLTMQAGNVRRTAVLTR